ncbi:metallophosphoesterase family protein [Roseomonas sp. CCTCC AB2023176]|uniref:metallophosphoesterase family protein n=1 Tax=Roseomonas sp. CCTCC AB2023176 TaxID=3342640 RepID=UPI0035D649CF
MSAAVPLVIQVSDTHLRRGDEAADLAFATAAGWIARRRPDLVVHTGDIVGGAVDEEADHAHAAALLRALPCPVRCIPGNHDVGDGPPRPPSVTAERVARFEAFYGPAQWHTLLDGWTLVGADAMRCETGLDEALVWEEVALAALAPRAILFLHKAPFLLDPAADGTATRATLPAASRLRLAEELSGFRGIVACGHRHEFRLFHRGGATVVWAPAVAPLLAEANPPAAPLPAFPGLIEYDLRGETAIIRHVPLDAARIAIAADQRA